LLRLYFPEAIEFFFPTIAELIDWNIPPEFLDKEFQQIAGDAAIGRRYADQLVKVYRKQGKPLVLLIHIEIQAQKEINFPERMLIYAIRIFELFQQPATSLAILCDNNAKQQSNFWTTPKDGVTWSRARIRLRSSSWRT
jgi:hypothetical protein